MKDDPCEYRHWLDEHGRMRARRHRCVRWLNIGTVILVLCLAGLAGMALTFFISGLSL